MSSQDQPPPRDVTTGVGTGEAPAPPPPLPIILQLQTGPVFSGIFVLRRVSLFVFTSFLASKFHNRVYY